MSDIHSPLDGVKEATILDSLEADFDKMTWTFGLGLNTEVGAGLYAILPSEVYRRQHERLERAEAILSRMCELETEETIGRANYEAVLRFFDPLP